MKSGGLYSPSLKPHYTSEKKVVHTSSFQSNPNPVARGKQTLRNRVWLLMFDAALASPLIVIIV